MPMRTECKHFESRTYPSGDTVRKCNLDLAPEAPWRCPDACPQYARRLADAAWTYGSLVAPATPPEPPGLGDGSVAELLDAAEEIVNAAGARVRDEVVAARVTATERKGGRLRRLFRRR